MQFYKSFIKYGLLIIFIICSHISFADIRNNDVKSNIVVIETIDSELQLVKKRKPKKKVKKRRSSKVKKRRTKSSSSARKPASKGLFRNEIVGVILSSIIFVAATIVILVF